LLASLKPKIGFGVDFSSEMIKRGRERYPELNFIEVAASEINIDDTFDYIILSDLVNDLWDVQKVIEKIVPLSNPKTRILINFYSHLWQPFFYLASKFDLIVPHLDQNWLTVEDIKNLLVLGDLEPLSHHAEILWPFPPKFLANIFNRWLVKLWPFKYFAITNFVIARPSPDPMVKEPKPSVSVIIAARNEAGNILQIFERVPMMGSETEIVFVEGHSKDDTFNIIKEQIAAHPERKAKLLQQTGEGKGDAVRLGFAEASGDIVMILDADLTVPPEDLPRFYNSLVQGKGDFINGVRLIYPQEDEAMRFLNLLGNKFFSLIFSWLLDQPIKDTLCGTKVLWKEDYDRIAANRSYFGEFDPFGDFDLLFNAAKLGYKIIDMPIRYRERTYGDTNIDRWRHGAMLLRMVIFAATRIKFI